MILLPLRSTERVQSTAVVTGLLIAVNLAVFIYELTLPDYAIPAFVDQWGVVPDHLHVTTLVTSMFLHGGWLHLLGNLLYLWVFGRNVEDRIGGARFLIFYFVCGLLAGLMHVALNYYSPTPTIGASGAIAGVMGGYLIKFPRSRIITLFTIIVFFTTMEIPAAFLLIYWFGMQFLSGIGSLAQSSYAGGGTAWFAHVGGFIAGMLLIGRFPERRRWKSWHWDE